jgi:septum site-determining protein MinC
MPPAFASAARPVPRQENPPLELRGGTFALATVEIHDPNPDAFADALEAKLGGGASLEAGSPVVLEFGPACRAALTDPAEFAVVAQAHGLVPVGMRAADTALEARATAAGLARITASPLLDGTSAKRATLFVDGPVRSGQSVYAAGSDLVVNGPVSGGAELLADGSIHVYGALRGRALAGVGGDELARIFASGFSAELVSIAGRYLSADDVPAHAREGRTQVRLADGCLRFTTLP